MKEGLEKKSKEEILEDYGCPDIPFDENVTMYYPAIIEAMEEYKNQQLKESESEKQKLKEVVKDLILEAFEYVSVSPERALELYSEFIQVKDVIKQLEG